MPQVELFTRRGCHLCEQTEAVLRGELVTTRFALRVTDVDADPKLARRYGARVPVVVIDGREAFELAVAPDALRAALPGGPSAR